jgi:hypothetical protein
MMNVSNDVNLIYLPNIQYIIYVCIPRHKLLNKVYKKEKNEKKIVFKEINNLYS